MKLLKICLSIIFLLCLLSACNPPDIETTATPEQPAGLDIEEIESDGVTVVLFKSPIIDYDNEMASYLSELLAREGWDVEFEIFDYYSSEYEDYKKRNEAYQKFIMNLLDSGKDLVFENRGGLDTDEFRLGGYLARDSEGKYDYFRRMGHWKEYSFQGIYIRKNLEEIYGEDIVTMEDYSRFLTWVKENNPDDTPCMMVMQSPNYDAFNPISLFAQAAGYTRIDHAVSGLREEQSTLYMSDIDMYNYQNDTPGVNEAAELPFFLEMDSYLNKWVKNGFIEFIDYDNFETTSGYSSIVCNTRNTTNYYSRDYTNDYFRLLDLSDFNLYIILENPSNPYSPHIYEHSRSSMFYFASDKPSKSLGKSFLEWIYESSDNYHLFMYGIEGVDYEVIDGQLKFMTNPNGLIYGLWPAHVKFIDDTMSPVMPHFPSNWAEVQHAFSQTDGFNIRGSTTFTEKDGTDISTNEVIIKLNSLSALDAGVYAMYDRYFTELGRGENRYTPWDLGVDLDASVSVKTRKENYRKILVLAGGTE